MFISDKYNNMLKAMMQIEIKYNVIIINHYIKNKKRPNSIH